MEQKRKRGRPRTVERERTVMLAMENYWREGLHALSINEVCRRANLSKPSLYREFGGEDGLLDAALNCYAQEVIAPMAEAVATHTSFLEGTESMIEVITSRMDGPEGCLLVKMRGATERLGPLTKARVDGMVQRMRESYASMFSRGLERGEVRSDVTPELAGRYIDMQVTTMLRKLGAGEDRNEVAALGRLAFSALVAG